jgi:hypothetical protein
VISLPAFDKREGLSGGLFPRNEQRVCNLDDTC